MMSLDEAKERLEEAKEDDGGIRMKREAEETVLIEKEERMNAADLIEKAQLIDYPENGAFIIATVDQDGKVNMNGFGDMRMMREFGVMLIERCAEQRFREDLAKAIVQH